MRVKWVEVCQDFSDYNYMINISQLPVLSVTYEGEVAGTISGGFFSEDKFVVALDNGSMRKVPVTCVKRVEP